MFEFLNQPAVQQNMTLGVFTLVIIALFQERIGPEIVMLTGLLLLVLCGVLDLETALSGFANSGVIMIGALYVVGAGLQSTGGIEIISRTMLGRPTAKTGLMRLMAPVAALSGFMNNTPLVAFFMPVFIQLAKRLRVSPSRFLIPLSYAAIMGGVCTLLGTSTNLVTQAILKKNDLAPMTMFELSAVGVPIAILGLIYLSTIGRRLLPDREDLLEHLEAHRREYTIEMLVSPHCPLTGKTVRQAGLRELPGLYLYRIERGSKSLDEVDPDTEIFAGDVLSFSGIASTVVDLQRIRGLTPIDHVPQASPQLPANDTAPTSVPVSTAHSLDSFEGTADAPAPAAVERIGRELCEVVVSTTSPLIGQSIRETNFRSRYNGSILAVHRSGEKLEQKIGKIILQAGDTLLIDADDDFIRRWRHSPDFILVSGVEDSAPVAHERAWISIAIFVTVLVGMSLPNFGEPAVIAMLGAVVMIFTGCVRSSDAPRSIQLPIIILVGAALGIGEALKTSGAARLIAESMLHATGVTSPWAVLVVIYVLTMLLSELLSNNATAAMMGSLALALAAQMNVSPRPFLIAITIAASCAFASPIGYQTNLMVLNAGGYKFSDYVRVGVPLDVLCMIIACILIPLLWSF